MDESRATPPAPGALDPAVASRARAVRLLSCDVDGVLTDGRIYVDDEGRETKAFHALDGIGFKRLKAAGVEVAWITGSASASVAHRARALGIAHLVRGTDDKLPAWERLRASLGLPSSACAHDVKRHVHYVTRREGGHGAAREVCELILASLGRTEIED